MSAHEPYLPASLRAVLRVAVGVYAAFIIWQSLVPAGTGGAIPHLDKLLHAIVYAFLAAGISAAWPRISKKLVLLGCIALGAVLEIVQGMMATGRTASLWDALANSVGALLGIYVVVVLTRKFMR